MIESELKYIYYPKKYSDEKKLTKNEIKRNEYRGKISVWSV